MPRIPAQTIEAIRRKASIESVIGHYIPVIKKGSSFVAVCPFHDDHNPSLNISIDKQIFKCFSCGAAGDVFSFVEKFEHVNYVTAIKKVADLVNYPLDIGLADVRPAFVPTAEHKAVAEAVLFCQHELVSEGGQEMIAYLQKRQISAELMEKYQFGYNPANDALYHFLSRKGFSDETLISSNLCRLTQSGVRDVFYQRLMIPIHDRSGHPIGFTARSLDPEAAAKYINTAETPLFHKGSVIFNWHRAAEPVRQQGFVILAEGPMDVIAFDKCGLANAVCTMGTNAAKGQLALIKQLSGQLTIAYDGDQPGQSAIFKVGQLAIGSGLKVSVMRNETALDPDEIIKTYGAAELKAMIQKPYSWFEFVIKYGQTVYDLANYDARKQFAAMVMEQLRYCRDEFDRTNYRQQVSALTGFNSAMLDILVKPETAGSETLPVKERKAALPYHSLDGIQMAEMTILKQMMLSNQAAMVYKDTLNTLPQQTARLLAGQILDWYNSHDQLKITEFTSSLADEPLRDMIFEIESSELISENTDSRLLADAISTIKIGSLEDQIRTLKKEISQIQDPRVQARYAEKYQQLLFDKISIEKEKKEGNENG